MQMIYERVLGYPRLVSTELIEQTKMLASYSNPSLLSPNLRV